MGWHRNSGSVRADTRLPTKPSASSTIPARKVTVSIAAIVDRNVGAMSVAAFGSTLRAP